MTTLVHATFLLLYSATDLRSR